MHESHQKSISAESLQIICKGGDHRENVQGKDHQQGEHADTEIKKYPGCASVIVMKKHHIADQDKAGQQNHKPDDQGLDEVILKSPEKGFRSLIKISLCVSHHAVIKGRQRRADGDHRDAAQNKEQIGNYNVSHIVKKYMNNIIFV